MRKEKERGLCTAIALYDLDVAKVNLKGLFEWAEGWFEKNNRPPTRASASGADINHKTTKTFKYVKKFFADKRYQNINSLWIGAPSDNYGSDVSGSLLSVGISYPKRNNVFDLVFHHSIIPHSWEYCESLVQEITAFVPSSYGIAFQRDLIRGPSFYVIGMDAGTVSDFTPEGQAEGDMISRWFHNYGDPKYWYTGMLRDVYPLNFLSQAHLANQVEGMPFDQWVASDLARGTLNPLTDSMWS
ncbi:MAG: hypothetical protein J0G29_05880, partial [Alphaproteobacteria bacterium]|nr:hypothetical protein [Alphaproteobacteria bacterium]